MRILWWSAIACAVILGVAGGLSMKNGSHASGIPPRPAEPGIYVLNGNE
jgi:hypothetical protein